MTLILLAIAIILYAVFGLFVSKAAGKVDDYLANAIFNGMAGIIPLAIFLGFTRKPSNSFTKEGLVASVIAGVCITIFSVILVKIFARGGNLAYVMPVTYGGVIVVGSFLGWLFLKESIAPLQLAGIALITVGVGCVVASKL